MNACRITFLVGPDHPLAGAAGMSSQQQSGMEQQRHASYPLAGSPATISIRAN
jgi:hypothetical protein